MSSTLLEDDVFEKLKEKASPEEQRKREQDANSTAQEQFEKSRRRVGELVDANSTLPVTISSVRVLHAKNTRKGFLQRIVNPLLSANRDDPYTLNEAIQEVASVAHKLDKFDIFQEPISAFIDKPDPADPNTSPSDIDVTIACLEKSRFQLKTGTEAGHAEGSAYAAANIRNVFGGAERLRINGSLGTRTRSAYSAAFETPVFSNPGLIFELGGLSSATLKPWASHEEVQRGGLARLEWVNDARSMRYEMTYGQFWRQITSLAEGASQTVRADAGDSVKSSLTYMWEWDRRDNRLLPTRGAYLRTTEEVAGAGYLGGDVSFVKLELESQAAFPLASYRPKVSIPESMNTPTQPELPAAVSLTTSFRAGLLHPLSFGSDSKDAPSSRLNDRFTLGGPTDIRGFRMAGIGPRDGSDAVGGDAYAAAGLGLLLPFPRVAPETPLRFQAFINGGRLVALGARAGSKEGSAEGRLQSAWKQMSNGWPSCAAGLGVVYAHPAARFEINFSLPLVTRQGEEARKGLQFGVGLSFM